MEQAVIVIGISVVLIAALMAGPLTFVILDKVIKWAIAKFLNL